MNITQIIFVLTVGFVVGSGLSYLTFKYIIKSIKADHRKEYRRLNHAIKGASFSVRTISGKNGIDTRNKQALSRIAGKLEQVWNGERWF